MSLTGFFAKSSVAIALAPADLNLAFGESVFFICEVNIRH